MAFTIDQNTIIDRGLQLSKNFLLEHVSSGAYQPVLNQWIPKYSATLIPDAKLAMNLTGGLSTPLWQIASNLQAGANGLLERLLSSFGGDLIIQSGFMNNLPFGALQNEIQHLTGNSFDIQIKGLEGNMYNIAKEIQKVSKVADEINLVFGSATSWMHIGVNPQRLGQSLSNLPDPRILTSDLLTGVTEQGLTSMRGFF